MVKFSAQMDITRAHFGHFQILTFLAPETIRSPAPVRNYGAKPIPEEELAQSFFGELRCKTNWGGIIIKNYGLKCR